MLCPSPPAVVPNNTMTAQNPNFKLNRRALSPGKRFAYSATQLFSPTSPTSPTSPPPPSSFTLHPYAQSQSSSAASLAQVSKVDHAAFCSCTTCSASKYEVRAATPTPYDLRPTSPISLRPEKRKGWMHRITIPVGNVFMLDAKKSSHAQGLGFRE